MRFSGIITKADRMAVAEATASLFVGVNFAIKDLERWIDGILGRRGDAGN
jgi:hypothetical protein